MDELILFPGATVGVRQYFGKTDRVEGYIDLQLALLGLTGMGFGVATTKFEGFDRPTNGLRKKFWGGAFGLLVYDRTTYPNMQPINSIGLMGVLPFADINIPPD